MIDPCCVEAACSALDPMHLVALLQQKLSQVASVRPVMPVISAAFGLCHPMVCFHRQRLVSRILALSVPSLSNHDTIATSSRPSSSTAPISTTITCARARLWPAPSVEPERAVLLVLALSERCEQILRTVFRI